MNICLCASQYMRGPTLLHSDGPRAAPQAQDLQQQIEERENDQKAMSLSLALLG